MHRPRVDPIDAVYAAFCKRMARLGYIRSAHEGPRAYADRLQSAVTLTAHHKHLARQFLMQYEEYRYARNQMAERTVTRTTLLALLKQIQ